MKLGENDFENQYSVYELLGLRSILNPTDRLAACPMLMEP